MNWNTWRVSVLIPARFTPILARFHNPVQVSRGERRWLEGFYLDVPEEWDDPYRFFR